MPLPVNSYSNTLITAGGAVLPTTVVAFALADIRVERQLDNGSFVTLTSPTEYTAAISSVNQRVTITLAEASTGVIYRISNIASVAQLSDYTLASYDPTRLTTDFDKTYLHIQRLYAAIEGIEAAADAGDSSAGVVNLHGLDDTGLVDQTQAFLDLLAETVSEGTEELEIAGKLDGSSAILIDRRAISRVVPARVKFTRVTLIFNAENGAGLTFFGDEVELPTLGKAKLAANVDASGGPVTTFNIDVSANTSIVALLVAGAVVVIRGQNGLDGDVLDGHKHTDRVVSCTLVSGTIYSLTLASGLPNTVPDGIWYVDWEDSDHLVDPDQTLISVMASVDATEDMTDSRTMSVAEGSAAAFNIVPGAWVQVLDDAVGSDTHGTSNEPLNQQTVRVQSVTVVDSEDDVITFDEPIRGALTTANNARVVLLDTLPDFELVGPGPAFPYRVIGTPPASPASRRHIFEAKFGLHTQIYGWRYDYVSSDGSTRGAHIRISNCHSAKVHHNWIENPWPDFEPATNGGDYYCIWDKGSSNSLIEHNFVRGGRHPIVVANYTNSIVRFNDVGHGIYQNIDLHGEGGYGIQVYGNRIERGPAWSERDHYVAIQVGNQTHTDGSHNVIIRDNDIVGFDEAEDVGILVISGCKTVIIDQHFIYPIGIGVQVEADRRAPDVLLEDILILGSAPAATIGVVLEGRMQVWASETEVFGSASRPTYIDDSTGTRRYVTEDEGTLGTVNPTHTSGTVASGDIDLEYVGPVSSETVPIDGVIILAELSGAGTDIVQNRATNVTVGGSGGGTAWGDITGTLSSQTDLGAALAAKVAGPASVTDERIALFDGTTGKLIKEASVGISDLATAAQGALADTATQPADLAVVDAIADEALALAEDLTYDPGETLPEGWLRAQVLLVPEADLVDLGPAGEDPRVIIFGVSSPSAGDPELLASPVIITSGTTAVLSGIDTTKIAAGSRIIALAGNRKGDGSGTGAVGPALSNLSISGGSTFDGSPVLYATDAGDVVSTESFRASSATAVIDTVAGATFDLTATFAASVYQAIVFFFIVPPSTLAGSGKSEDGISFSYTPLASFSANDLFFSLAGSTGSSAIAAPADSGERNNAASGSVLQVCAGWHREDPSTWTATPSRSTAQQAVGVSYRPS